MKPVHERMVFSPSLRNTADIEAWKAVFDFIKKHRPDFVNAICSARESSLILKLCNDVDSWLNVFRLIAKYKPDVVNACASSYSNQLSLAITYFNGDNRERAIFKRLKTNLMRDINKVDGDLVITFSEELK